MTNSEEKYTYVREGRRLSIRDKRDGLEVGFIEAPEGATAQEIVDFIHRWVAESGVEIPAGEN